MEDSTRFISICGEKIKRDGIQELLAWLSKTDFYEAPASTRFHLCCKGGLCKHSLNVYDAMQKVVSAFPKCAADEESIAIAALFHDLCKVNFYVPEKKNRKNALGQWESYDSYSIKEKFSYGGHGSKSVYLLQNFIKLKPEEAIAINCHMGFSDGSKDVGNAYEQCPFAWALHVADEAASFLDEASSI